MIITTEAEREGIRASGKILAHILEELAHMTKPGVTNKALDVRARELMHEAGASSAFLNYKGRKTDRPFPGVICLSVNEGLVHGVPNETEYVFKKGDIVKIDCGVNYHGFFTDSALTVGVGAIDPLHAELLVANQEALEAQIRMAVAGNTIGDIGYVSEQVADTYGFGYPTTLGGHGVGRAVHEKPFIQNYGDAGTGETLVEGMVLALEPMFATGKGDVVLAPDGWTYVMKDNGIGSHFEHTVIVGADGAEVVTRRPSEE